MARRAFYLILFASPSVAWGQVEDPTLDLNLPPPTWLPEGGGGTGVSEPQIVEMWVSTNNDPGLDYCAAILDYGTGGCWNNLFIKIQSKDGSPEFENIYFFMNHNGGSWPGMTGGGAIVFIPAFDNAIYHVEHDGMGNVTVIVPTAVVTRGGWCPNSGKTLAGLGSFAGLHRMDDFKVNGQICDDFDRPDGPLGSGWNVLSGTMSVSNGRAVGSPGQPWAVFVGECRPACTGGEFISKARCRNGTLVVKVGGGVPGDRFTADTQGQSQSAILGPNGRAKVNFTGLKAGFNEVLGRWRCGAIRSRGYKCP